MDIVSRLKSFINFSGVPVTQFADNCRIPRPTLSQLLNGRNKKVSDELIGKIHEAYPQLSVLWLMFGEGNMLHNENFETSEPQNGPFLDFSNQNNPEKQTIAPTLDFSGNFQSAQSNRMETEKVENPATPSTILNMTDTSSSPKDKKSDISATLSFNPDQSKKIVNIIVYYNDNSFESFVPSPEK